MLGRGVEISFGFVVVLALEVLYSLANCSGMDCLCFTLVSQKMSHIDYLSIGRVIESRENWVQVLQSCVLYDHCSLYFLGTWVFGEGSHLRISLALVCGNLILNTLRFDTVSLIEPGLVDLVLAVVSHFVGECLWEQLLSISGLF